MKKYLAVLFSFVLALIAFNSQAESDEAADFSDAELEQILAPIALYPDSVLTHILIASTYPLEVIQANRWVEKNPDVAPGDAMDKVENEPWDPSVKALIPFPDLLKRLSDDLDWTQRLGDAFLQDEERVLDAIQSLRNKADKAGSLSKMENVKVVREEKVIVIEPAQPEVIYVPYYDTRVVYGPWYWDHYPPVYWYEPYYVHRYNGPFYWYPQVHISFGFFFSAFHWHNHHVVVIEHNYRDRHYYRRSEILRNTHVDRWRHNPQHRRGVAYSNNQVRERYNSIRPSREQTRTIRANERNIVEQRQINKDGRRVNINKREQNIEPVISRQQKLKERLEVHEQSRREEVNTRQINKQQRVENKSSTQRSQRNIDQRDIRSRTNENKQREVLPKQERSSNENSRREQRQQRDENKNTGEEKPVEDRQQDDREPPENHQRQNREVSTRAVSSRSERESVSQQDSRRQNQERDTQTRSTRSQRAERDNSRATSRSSRGSDNRN